MKLNRVVKSSWQLSNLFHLSFSYCQGESAPHVRTKSHHCMPDIMPTLLNSKKKKRSILFNCQVSSRLITVYRKLSVQQISLKRLIFVAAVYTVIIK